MCVPSTQGRVSRGKGKTLPGQYPDPLIKPKRDSRHVWGHSFIPTARPPASVRRRLPTPEPILTGPTSPLARNQVPAGARGPTLSPHPLLLPSTTICSPHKLRVSGARSGAIPHVSLGFFSQTWLSCAPLHAVICPLSPVVLPHSMSGTKGRRERGRVVGGRVGDWRRADTHRHAERGQGNPDSRDSVREDMGKQGETQGGKRKTGTEKLGPPSTHSLTVADILGFSAASSPPPPLPISLHLAHAPLFAPPPLWPPWDCSLVPDVPARAPPLFPPPGPPAPPAG